MKTFKSFLAFYNEMDVGPMVTACKSWLRYYHDTDKIDVLKDTIGLPSIARCRMYEAASKFPGFMGFSLTENSHQNLEKLIVSNTCGGPSIVFTRYHEAGKTDSGQQEVQPAANELLPQTRRHEAQVEYRFGGENWALFCGRFLARRAENHRTGRMFLPRLCQV